MDVLNTLLDAAAIIAIPNGNHEDQTTLIECTVSPYPNKKYNAWSDKGLLVFKFKAICLLIKVFVMHRYF